jgi:AcrR family transcriptional regulator
MARAYDSPLREEQARQTRERIVQSTVELMIEDPTAPITMARVAERAQVSVRTVYRHFESQEGLVAALQDRIRSAIGLDLDVAPESLSDLRRRMHDAYGRLLDDEPFQRAKLVSPMGPEAAQRERSKRLGWIAAAVDAEFDDLAEPERRRLVGLLRVLCTTGTYFSLVDLTDLDHDEAADALDWAVEALAQATRGS